MMEKEEQISRFFDEYAGNFQRVLNGEEPDVEKAAACFAACFVESSPAGVKCGKNDAEFREMIPHGYRFYREVGITAMDIRAQRVEVLDELHAMNRIEWNSSFHRKDGVTGSINFEVIYLLRLEDERWKIFAYITGDEQQALKDNGLV
jgi:hypothetical protein